MTVLILDLHPAIELTDEQSVEILQNPASLSGENVLPGFFLDLTEIL
jgi:hypothetical protein